MLIATWNVGYGSIESSFEQGHVSEDYNIRDDSQSAARNVVADNHILDEEISTCINRAADFHVTDNVDFTAEQQIRPGEEQTDHGFIDEKLQIDAYGKQEVNAATAKDKKGVSSGVEDLVSFDCPDRYDVISTPTKLFNINRHCGFRMVHSFRDKEEFVRVHLQGTIAEMAIEEAAIQRFNDHGGQRFAWVIAPIPGPYSLISSDLQTKWIVLVELPEKPEIRFPNEGDMCKLGFAHEFKTRGRAFNPGMLTAERIHNPFDGVLDMPQYTDRAAFNVTMEYIADPVTGERYHPLSSIAMPQLAQHNAPPELSRYNAVMVTLRVESNPVTYETELAALTALTEPKRDENGPPERNLQTFDYLLDFRRQPEFWVDLFEDFPHMDQPAGNPNTPRFLKSVYNRLNRDHKKVYEQLRKIPAGIAMVLGCPGAGKTALNAFISAMALSGSICEFRNGRQQRKRVKILYLLDVNYPCDDAANRVFNMLKDAGIKKSVIRVRGCAREMSRSAKLHPSPPSSADDESVPDFTAGFLKQARLASCGTRNIDRDDNRAPSLDEAAWDRFDADRAQHKALSKLLEKLDSGAVKTKRTVKELKTCVAKLYFSVAREADFIATTPVGASGKLSKIFKADLVFLDEAAHARELTSMIPLAFYSARAYIFTGDTRQTRPFVEGTKGRDGIANPYANQLAVSTMERADLAGALKSKLLISHRMYGNLHKLASELFYDGLLTSGVSRVGLFPPPVQNIQRWLTRCTHGQDCLVPRVLVNHRRSQEIKSKTSFYNPIHEAFIKERCIELLENVNFKQVDRPDKPGRILIITPYKAALGRYKRFIEVLPSHLKGRPDIQEKFKAIEVRTVDSAQGHEADFVFVDTVRTNSAGFLDDPKRLCVMLTRARIGEMVLMNEGMTKKPIPGSLDVVEATWTYKVYNHCRENGQLYSLV
ncbi:Regulator of nonsense transcripts 1-like protein 1 [Colletotrichum chlorophyti]|uniref:Regulator of nonsense transcripts 1-like protein 1 n=1 Tax=Colletotrichum chlorophyti TaxID=708187 RepID=A0A1Q8S581_9PEZI|nr:Regulator of nonsense transcripts 1-like protein 1 [Colletotrichum chlorophyti]